MAGKILIYSHDTYGIGNIRRTVELCRTLDSRIPGVSVLVITGSPLSECFEIPGNVGIVKLPEILREDRGRYGPRADGFLPLEIRSVRAEICRTVVQQFAPDVVLVDKAPLGVDRELRPALDLLRRERPDCVRILGLRDILDDPEYVRAAWRTDGTPREMMEYYDAVWVFGSPLVFEMEREYGMPPGLSRKLSYLGYIGRTEPIRPGSEIRDELDLGPGPIVVASAGGGEDGRILLTTYARMIPRLRESHPGVANVLVTGPRAEKSTWDVVRRACAEDRCSRVLSFTPRILDLMSAATALVSMGGYNTACEALLLGKPTVMVPRSEPVLEQRVRALRLRELGAVRVCLPEDLTPPVLLEQVRALLDGWRPAGSVGDAVAFTGLGEATKRIRRFLAPAGIRRRRIA